jgi:hypothetical protein
MALRRRSRPGPGRGPVGEGVEDLHVCGRNLDVQPSTPSPGWTVKEKNEQQLLEPAKTAISVKSR